MSTAAPTFKLEDIQTGELFSINLPERFDNITPVFILGKQRIGDMEHYRVISSRPMYRGHSNVKSADINAPFSIILKSGDEDAIREVFKYWNEGQWKTLVHYGKREYGEWSDAFEYIFEMTDRKKLSSLLETMEEMKKDGRHQNNKLGPVKSKLINPSELKKGERYLIETVHEGRIGSIDIAIIRNVSSRNSGKTTITYRVKDGLPFEQTITIDSTGNSDSGGRFYFYKRPTIEQAMEDINLSDDRIRLLKFRKNTRAEMKLAPEKNTGVRNYRFPPREGPPRPPKANVNASAELQTGGKRKTRGRRRIAKKSRKQRKN